MEYLTYEPASVFERKFERDRSTGATCEAYLEVGPPPAAVLHELHDAYTHLPEPNEKLLLSMEIFCAAGLESSQRAVFLALVSALEPLASKVSLGNEVKAFVDDCIARLGASSSVPSDLKVSLRGRLRQLGEESIRQALRRLAHETLPSQSSAEQAIDDGTR